MADKPKTIMDEQVHYHKYTLKEFMVNIPGEKPVTVRDHQVTDIMIEKDFQVDHFPIMRMRCHFDPLLLEKIIKNKSKVTFKVRIQKKPSNNAQNKQMPVKDVFNKVFAIYTDIDDPFYDRKLYYLNYGGTGKVNPKQMAPRDFDNPVDFYLFSDKELNATKKPINIVFSSINMTDAVVYALGTAGFGNLLMAPLDNSTSYKQVVLPPMNALETVDFLEQVYGLYNDGAIVFFDYDRGYVIPACPVCKAWAPQEYKEVVLISKGRNNEGVMGHGSLDYSKEKKFVVNILPESISVESDSDVGNHIVGNKITAIDGRNNSVTDSAGKTNQRGQQALKVVSNRYGNKFAINALSKRRTAGSKIINITLGDVDIDIFKPNRAYKLICEEGVINQQIGGSYMLKRTVTLFRKTNGRDFEATTVVTLTK